MISLLLNMYYTFLFETLRCGIYVYTYTRVAVRLMWERGVWDAGEFLWKSVTDAKPDSIVYLHGYGEGEFADILVRETIINGESKSLISYDRKFNQDNPFDRPPAKLPWIWIGNSETEEDWTERFHQYIVVGNHITSKFVSLLTKGESIKYMDPSFTLHEFDEQGVIIEADVS